MMNDVFLSIGTNIGNRAANLQEAVRKLIATPGIEVKAVSSIYETAAVGFTEQADFLNIAVYIQSALGAVETLLVCQAIENDLGRVREFRWGPRIIDLDILLFNHENMDTEQLMIPHPRMYERAFVLVPLMELSEYNPSMLQKAKEHIAAMDIQAEGVNEWKSIESVEMFLCFES